MLIIDIPFLNKQSYFRIWIFQQQKNE